MVDNDNKLWFDYDNTKKEGQIEYFGQFWYLLGQSKTNGYFIKILQNDHFGELIISDNALEYFQSKEDVWYKLFSLLHEKSLLGLRCSLVANNEDPIKWRDEYRYISCTVDQFLKEFPSNVMVIQQRALLSLHKKYKNYGQRIDSILLFHFFSRDQQELGFILNSMIEKEWLKGEVKSNGDGTIRLIYPFSIAVKGWVEIENQIAKNNSSQVFIAMRFHKSTDLARDAIKRAIRHSSLNPLSIDEKEHINRICSEIQYEIKNSGLVIADVTGQNQGVYYEAGYAMGLNIPVIWCCRCSEADQLHFDTRQYNHILWKNEEDLYNRLKARIIAITGLKN
jgi:hypothetical protein